MPKTSVKSASALITALEAINATIDGLGDLLGSRSSEFRAGDIAPILRDLERAKDKALSNLSFPPPLPSRVYVFCRGGMVNDVTDPGGIPHSGACIIDYDLLDCGECPVCYNTLDSDLTSCPRCTFRLNKYSTIEEALRAVHILESEKG